MRTEDLAVVAIVKVVKIMAAMTVVVTALLVGGSLILRGPWGSFLVGGPM